MFKLNVDIADNSDTRRKGLSGLQYINPNKGMLFVYSEPRQSTFWMKDTYIPLDLSFINNNWIIQEQYKLYPFDEQGVSSDGEYRFALETVSGVLENNGIDIGSKIYLLEDMRELIMTNNKFANEIILIAKELIAQDEDVVNVKDFKKIDPSLNSAVTKVINVTNGDIAKMLTIVIMAMKKTGHASEATKLFNIFRRTLKRVENILEK